MLKIRLLLISTLLLLQCTDESKNQTSTLSDSTIEVNESLEIKHLLEDYYQTMSDRDWQAYKSFFWKKATITTKWFSEDDSSKYVHIVTIDDFISQTAAGPDSQPIFEEKMLNSNIDIKGNLGVGWVEYSAKFGTKEQLMEWTGKDLFTFMKNNDQWKIVALVFESD